jgi:hypothetical protein
MKRNRRTIMSTGTRLPLRPSELRSDRRHPSRWVLVEVAGGAVVDEEASALSKCSGWQPIVPHPNSTMTSRLWRLASPSSSCHPESLQPTGRSFAILRHQPRARPRRRARRTSRTHFSLAPSFTHGLYPVESHQCGWYGPRFRQRSALHSVQWVGIYTQPATPNYPWSFRARWQRGPSIKRRCAVQGGSTTFHRGCSGGACYGIGRHGLVPSEKRRPLTASVHRCSTKRKFLKRTATMANTFGSRRSRKYCSSCHWERPTPSGHWRCWTQVDAYPVRLLPW